MTNIPQDVWDIISTIIPHEKREEQENDESNFERVYQYDYSDYPEKHDKQPYKDKGRGVVTIDL